MYICVYIYIYMWVCVYIYICVFAYILCTYLCVYIHIYEYASIFMDICVCVCRYMCVHTNIHIHTCIYTHIYAYTHFFPLQYLYLCLHKIFTPTTCSWICCFMQSGDLCFSFRLFRPFIINVIIGIAGFQSAILIIVSFHLI